MVEYGVLMFMLIYIHYKFKEAECYKILKRSLMLQMATIHVLAYNILSDVYMESFKNKFKIVTK